jgi:hypothetical protein
MRYTNMPPSLGGYDGRVGHRDFGFTETRDVAEFLDFQPYPHSE